MKSLNTIQLIGNVGKNPEIRYTTKGDVIASFSLATSENWTDKEGQKQERTEWHRVEAFGPLGQIARDYVVKGKPVFVQGQIRYDEFTDKEGVRRNITKVVLSNFNSRLILLGSKDPVEDVEKELLGEEDKAPIEKAS